MKIGCVIRILKKNLLRFVISLIIVYTLLPTRFAVKYEYIPDEDIGSNLVPLFKPSAKSCPLVSRPNNFNHEIISATNASATEYASFKKIHNGGFWVPEICEFIYDVAIVVPFRARIGQLDTFLRYLHPFMQRQLISYRVFVIEQTFSKPFNRGLLLNIGFIEALKFKPFQCFIFHDVDLLPLVASNMYACTHKPRHLCPAINSWRYNLKYAGAFGGVVAILQQQFSQINGFSNKYFGWGGEDDDFLKRIVENKLGYLRFSPQISKYHMLHHKPEKKNPNRMAYLLSASKRFLSDGINSANYTNLLIEEKPLYTHILVETCTIVMTATRLLCVDFEIFGKVQGVFFRKHTLEQATALGLRGWCMNTVDGTVRGSMEGQAESIEEMKQWLKFKGSPNSRIDRANFTNEKEIKEFSYDKFFVKH